MKEIRLFDALLSPEKTFRELHLDLFTSLMLLLYLSAFFGFATSFFYTGILLSYHFLPSMLVALVFLLSHSAFITFLSKLLGGKSSIRKMIGPLVFTYAPIQAIYFVALPVSDIFFKEPYILPICTAAIFLTWFSFLQVVCIREVCGISSKRSVVTTALFFLVVLFAVISFFTLFSPYTLSSLIFF
jgi:hypothetical protein